MNISSLLTAFMPARGDPGPVQDDVVVQPQGAEFVAILALPDTALPEPTAKPNPPKAASDDALIAQADVKIPDTEVLLPVFWQAIASDAVDWPDVIEHRQDRPNDPVQPDAAIAYCLSPLDLMPADAKISDASGEGVAVFADQNVGQNVALPPDFPKLVLAAEVVPQVQIVNVPADAPLRQADQAASVAHFPQIAPLGPPRATHRFLTESDARRGTASSSPEQSAPKQMVTGQTVTNDRADRALGSDFTGVEQVRAVQVPSGEIKDIMRHSELGPPHEKMPPLEMYPPLEMVSRPEVAPPLEKALALEMAPPPEMPPRLEIDRWIAPQGFDVSVPPPMGKAASENVDEAPLPVSVLGLPASVRDQSGPVLGQRNALQLLWAPTAPDPWPGGVIAGQAPTRLSQKPVSSQHLSSAAAVPFQTAIPPPDERLLQVDRPLGMITVLFEAPAKGDRRVTEFSVSFSDVPGAVLAADLQPTGATLGSAPLPQSAPQSEMPKSAPTLHRLPAVIEHLHSVAAREGRSHAELLMNPAELGRIQFDLITQGDQVQVTLSVERPETLELLRTNAEALRQEFRNAGLNADTLNFGQWAHRPPAHDQPEASLERAALDVVPQAISAPYVKPSPTLGLDLRL